LIYRFSLTLSLGESLKGRVMASEPAEVRVPIGAVKASAWFLENSPDIFLGVRAGVLARALPTWARLTGWPTEASEGRLFLDFVHPADRSRVGEALDALPEGERCEFDHRLSTQAGEDLWVHAQAVRGEDSWILMILRDVTQERRLRDEADQARQVAEMLQRTAGVRTWRYHPDLDRYDVNPDLARPAPAPDVEDDHHKAGASVRGAIHRADAPSLHHAWEQALRTGEAQVAQYRERAPGGGWRHIRVAWQGIRPASSGRWEILGIAQDVTDLTEARDAAIRGQAEAQAAAAAKSQFLANMSHEIRTPLNGVMGVLHLIRAEPPRSERRRLVDEALTASASLSDVLASIIDYADVEAGRLELHPEPTDPAAELAAVAALHRPRAQAKGLAFEVSCEIGGGAVLADAPRLRQVFHHLIGNAVKFTEAGSIAVRLKASGEGADHRLRLEVEDTGVGVPPAAQAELFQGFRQADGSSTRRFGGSGLGLAITRRLAELMGGAVGFSSREGAGSTFWAEIAAPACDAPEAGGGADTDASGWLSGLRVLVVEDNPTNRLVATRMLGMLGAEVVTAENGALGVAAVEASDFDLVFMDIQMPVMDGVEATRRIRALPGAKAAIPIVATTANVMPEQLATYRGCGIDGVVAKPISPNALLAEINRLASNDDDEETTAVSA
jgi:PAS domain S-box-containing protein